MTILLRPITQTDSAAIARMLHDLAEQTEAQVTPKVTAANIAHFGPAGKRHFDGLVAEQNGALVGMCLFSTTFSGWRGSSGLFISDLFVAPHVRGQGLGLRLLAATCEHAKAIDCTYLRLDVAPDNHNARAFYEKIGFSFHEDEMPLFLEQEGMQALITGL